MNNELEANNYIVVDNFITPEKAKELYNIFFHDLKTNPQIFTKDPQCPQSFAVYNYQHFVKLLCEKVSFMSAIMNEPMLPTYSYARIYQHGEVLTKHTDRPSCEISVTLNLGSDHPWNIYMTKPNEESVGIDLKPGQAIIYQGMISEHWRDAYEGNNYGQVFLHYVKGDGIYWNHYGDRNI